MKTAVCTISTFSHRFKTRALFLSLKEYTEADFFALYTDRCPMQEDDGLYEEVSFEQLLTKETARLAQYHKDKRRWGCKPFFVIYLLNKGYDSVIYVDNDTCFYASPNFLFDKLKEHSILLTPHYYPANPQKDPIWLEANFRVGLYNAGFMGVSKNGMEAMIWWGECCLYNLKKAYCRGLFDDQKYLDLMPVLFENVEVLRHRGCNIAGWNIETSLRTLNENGEVVLNGQWPIIFIHYNYFTIQNILSQKDSLLMPYWKQYLSLLRSENPLYNPKKEAYHWKNYWRTYTDFLKYKINRLFDGK